MTEKENLMLILKGEEPEWLPRYSTFGNPNAPYKAPVATVMPRLSENTREKGKDMFGVEYTPTESAGGASLPTPNKFILDDIRKWRDVIKVPNIDDLDFERMAKADLANIDRSTTAVALGTNNGYFQMLMNFMGFTNGLCTMIEEPEEVMALYEYLADFYDVVVRRAMKYYKPDILFMGDDIATAQHPFISVNLYRELVKPYHARLGQIAMEAGIPVDMHCCGHCEAFIDDWLDFGVKMWNPAQVSNDLVGIKKKYKGRLVLIGCWDSQGPAGLVGAPDDLIREEVRKCIDTYAPGGGFIFFAGVYGPQTDELRHHQDCITDEYMKYGRPWYKNHRS
ncbi:MAG: veratrol--corrinoid protein metyltransferase [Clostridiales bacterium]|nr:veratrol--corrinoid protein metyltransferase [Clostridiales bacterium]